MQVSTIEILKADEGKALHKIGTEIYCSSVMLREGQSVDEFEEIPLEDVPKPEKAKAEE